MSELLELATIESALQAYILDDGDQLLALDCIKATPPLSQQARGEIYRTAYRVRLQSRLADEFIQVKACLGESAFEQLTAAYVQQFPATTFSLHAFGDQFSTFLASLVETASSTSPLALASELAALEWAMAKAMEAADVAVLTLATLQALPLEAWPSLQFHLHPSMHYLTFKQPALTVWENLLAQATGESTTPIETLNETAPLQPLAELQACLVWREGVDVARYQALDAIEIALIAGIRESETFEQLCLRLCEHLSEETVAQEIIMRLQPWIVAVCFVSPMRARSQNLKISQSLHQPLLQSLSQSPGSPNQSQPLLASPRSQPLSLSSIACPQIVLCVYCIAAWYTPC